MQTWVPTDTFGVRLAMVRAELGLNITQAADRCGIKAESWRQWEHGSSPRRVELVARKVEEGLGVDHRWLLAGGPARALSTHIQRYAAA